MAKTDDQEVEEKPQRVDDAQLKEMMPKGLGLKLPKTPAARADLLYQVEQMRLGKKKEYDALDKFQTLLERWFIENLPAEDATGVQGTVGRVEIKRKEKSVAEDWPKIYAYILKNKTFDLLARKLNDKAVKERWEQKKAIPGVGTFTAKVVSLTAVRK